MTAPTPARDAAPHGHARRRRAGVAALGHTFVELLVTTAILLILAAAVLPIAAASRQREKEIELRRALREIRLALYTYHQICRASVGQGARVNNSMVTIKIEDDPDLTCFPKDLDVLVEGIETNTPDYKLRFLRRIPRDPFNIGEEDFDDWGWRLISTTDDPKGESWDRRNVFDVRSGVEWKALDGSYYEEW